MSRLTFRSPSYTTAVLFLTVVGFMACFAAYSPDPVMRAASAIAVLMCGIGVGQAFLEGEGAFASEPVRWCAGAALSALVGALQAGLYVALLALFPGDGLPASVSVPLLTLMLAAMPPFTLFASAAKRESLA